MTTFIDTNVLIYVLDENSEMHNWSVEHFEDRKAVGPVIISDIVYCEFSLGMTSKDDVDEALTQLAVERFDWNDDTLFRAGRAFRQYKEQNLGPKLNVLPDFLIGACAEIFGAPLLTANRKDFSGYFPNLQIISPEEVE